MLLRDHPDTGTFAPALPSNLMESQENRKSLYMWVCT